MFVLRTIAKNLPSIYSENTKYIVMVANTLGGAEMFLVCDVYSDEKPGIKDTMIDTMTTEDNMCFK